MNQETTIRDSYAVPSASRHLMRNTVAGGLASERSIENGNEPFTSTSIGSACGTYKSCWSCSVSPSIVTSNAVSVPVFWMLHRPLREVRSRMTNQLTRLRGAGSSASGPASVADPLVPTAADRACSALSRRSTRAVNVSVCARVASTLALKCSAFDLSSSIWVPSATRRLASAFLFARYARNAIQTVARIPAAVSQTIHQSASWGPKETGIMGIGVGTLRTLSGVTR